MKGSVGELDEEYSLPGRGIYGHPSFRVSLGNVDQLGVITQCDGIYKRLLMLFAVDVVAHRPFVLQAVCQRLILVVGHKCEVIIFGPWHLFRYHVDISVETCYRQRHVSRIVVKNCGYRVVSWTKTPENLLSCRITSYCWAPSYFFDHQALDREHDLDHFQNTSSAKDVFLCFLMKPSLLF